MSAIYHSTLFFAQGTYGWVEQYFRQDQSLASALVATVTLAAARWPILGAGANLYRVRVSQVGCPGISATCGSPGTPATTLAMSPLQSALRCAFWPGFRRYTGGQCSCGACPPDH